MRWVALGSMIVLMAGGLCPSAAPGRLSPEETLLQANKVPIEGRALLDHLRKQFTAPLGEDRIRVLIEQLGDDSFTIREEASRHLVVLGARVRKLLQDALKNGDLEIRHRAERCLQQIEGDGLSDQLTAAALRVLARRAPPGAAALILEQLPTFPDEIVGEAAREALVSLAVQKGAVEPALVAALTDRSPIRRAAAAVALARAGVPGQLPALRKLLGDESAGVRTQVALALVGHREKASVQVLIDALDGPITPQYGQIEEVLFRLAVDKSPTLTSDDLSARKQYRKEWTAWWKENEERADLSVVENVDRPLGRTLIVLLDDNQVLDLDRANRIRWKIEGVEMVLDAQPLPGDRVLLAEHNANRVTERNSKGEILWERRIPAPLSAQRLLNGNTLIATRSEVIEIDRSGRQVFRHVPPGGAQVMRACKLPGGDIILVSQLLVTHCVRLDRFGRVVKSFGAEISTSGGRLSATPSGNLLVPEMDNNRICEFDRSGRMVREIPAPRPIAAVSLPNGNVIVTSMSEKRALELDRSGKEVWEYRRDTRVTRAIRY